MQMNQVRDEQVLSVRGAFWQPDLAIFRFLLGATASTGGDLAEIGTLYGRSAILIGSYLQAGEEFTVVDLFETPASDPANASENLKSYPGLSRAMFEANYLSCHSNLPTIVQGPSSAVLKHARAGTHRLVHVDASHLYKHVRSDIESARTLLAPCGILILDDYRAEHTPGVAAAAWEAVATGGLRPFAVSPSKMYATWGDDARWRLSLEVWLANSEYGYETQVVNARPLLRVFNPPPRNHWARPYIPPAIWTVLARAKSRLGHSRPRRALRTSPV